MSLRIKTIDDVHWIIMRFEWIERNETEWDGNTSIKHQTHIFFSRINYVDGFFFVQARCDQWSSPGNTSPFIVSVSSGAYILCLTIATKFYCSRNKRTDQIKCLIAIVWRATLIFYRLGFYWRERTRDSNWFRNGGVLKWIKNQPTVDLYALYQLCNGFKPNDHNSFSAPGASECNRRKIRNWN